MNSNIDATRKEIEAQSAVEQLDLDYDTGSDDVVFRAFCEDVRESVRFGESSDARRGSGESKDIGTVIGVDDLPVDVMKVQHVGFGLEVTLR